MDPRRQMFNQIELHVDAYVKEANHIMSLMRTLNTAIEGRNNEMKEITKLQRSELREKAFAYNLMLNRKDIEKLAELDDRLKTDV
ncbi:hypothetical protein CTI12_AA630610 [Artemisia annua]|uniref:Uncharacterized protein n=1 Tax=Artemisia annua TaxID=35608 RepID=A0A2U1K8Y2_ARTAN|nr:hypothetical protein CTI12_AA630610 [Artemisia annua]